MRNSPPKLIGEILIELGYITSEDLQRALSIQKDLKKNQKGDGKFS